MTFHFDAYTKERPSAHGDPDGAKAAIPVSVQGISDKAQMALDYFAGAGYLFEYRGKLVFTDESLELVDIWYEPEARPTCIGGPRWEGKTMKEFEAWLEMVTDELIREKEAEVASYIADALAQEIEESRACGRVVGEEY